MKTPNRLLEILAALATIAALCVAVIALVPDFAQWLFPRKESTNIVEMPTNPPLTSVSAFTPTLQAIPTNTSTPQNTVTASSIPTLVLPSITPTPIQIALQSTFDGLRTEGWTINSGDLTNPGAGGSGGGLDNGCLVWSGGAGGRTSYFVAPSKYLGNWESYSELRLDLWSKGGKHFISGYGMYGDIFIVSGFATAQHSLPYRPPEQWATFVIPLIDDGEWIYGGGATTLADVLVNVTDFQIRAEYGEGSDTTGLDNVALVSR